MTLLRDDLIVQQGVTFAYGWPILDDDDEPMDMSAWTAEAQVRGSTQPDAPVLFEFGTETTAEGLVIIMIQAHQSRAFSWSRGLYDCLVTSPDHSVTAYVGGGSIRVNPVITR